MIIIEWLFELIEKIPSLLLYVVQGYIFIYIYKFILFKDNREEESTDFILLKSITISYVLKVIYDKILELHFTYISEGTFVYTIMLIIFSVFIAYSLAIISKTSEFNTILLNLGIKRTINNDIWTDVIREGHYLRIYSKDGQKSYSGQCKFNESHTNEPIVVLCNYQILDEDANVVADYADDDNRMIVLNLKDFERVDVTKAEKASVTPVNTNKKKFAFCKKTSNTSRKK